MIASSRSAWSRYRDSSATQPASPANCSAASDSAAASSPSRGTSLPSSPTCMTLTEILTAAVPSGALRG